MSDEGLDPRSPYTHRIAVLRNALAIAADLDGPHHGVDYLLLKRMPLFDDGLDDLRERLVGAGDPLGLMHDELSRLQAEEHMRREVAKRSEDS